MDVTRPLLNWICPAPILGNPAFGPNTHACVIHSGLTDVETLNICLLLVRIRHCTFQEFVDPRSRPFSRFVLPDEVGALFSP